MEYLVSAEKPMGTAEPRIGIEIRKVRALEAHHLKWLNGMTEMMARKR